MKPNRLPGTEAELILSFDDYHPSNVRIAEAMNRLGLVATFFIETLPAGAMGQIEELHAMGHEIGSHTLHHPPDIKQLSSEQIVSEVTVSKHMIEDVTGKPCETIAYPRGRFNDDVIEIVKRAGYLEARTTHVLKTSTEDPFRTPTTIHAFDGRKEYGGRTWEVMARFYLDHVIRKGGFFHLWGHAFEFERDGTLPKLEAFLKTIDARP